MKASARTGLTGLKSKLYQQLLLQHVVLGPFTHRKAKCVVANQSVGDWAGRVLGSSPGVDKIWERFW